MNRDFISAPEGAKLNLNYPKAGPLPPMNPFESVLDETMDFIGRDLFTYLCEIKDPDIAAILCAVSQEKVRQTFSVLDNFVKAAWAACSAMPDFAVQFKQLFQTPDCKSRQEFSALIGKNGTAELKHLTDHITKLTSYKKTKDSYESSLNAELKLSANLSVQNIADQLKELVDFSQHTIRRKNFKRRSPPAPAVQTLTECYKQKDFDNLHKEKVNCVDICPYSRLLASGSSDGTIRFVDLDDLAVFKELVLTEPEKKGIFSLCIDNNHSVAYVNESNLLRVVDLSLNHVIFKYQGQVLGELTDEITEQTVQFTPDFKHLAFRSGPKTILFFCRKTLALERKIETKDKIRDFSVAAACDYLATASYEALETEIYETYAGHLVSKTKFDSPVFSVQWAPNGIHLLFGAGNGKAYLVEFAKYHDKSLRVMHVFDNLFSLSSGVSAISISLDSQFAAVGSRNGDFKVKILNLWERQVQLKLPDDLHTYNVSSVKFSRNGKYLATCSEDTTVKVLLLR
jgi:WD40 repeat protein